MTNIKHAKKVKIKEILYWIKQKKTNKNINKKKIEIKWKRIRK